jgi:hypothetical protein
LSNNAIVNAGGNFSYISTAAASYYQQTAGQHTWFNAPSGTAGNAITFTQAMTLDASGRLGVGRTSLGAQLDVLGAASTSAMRIVGNSGASIYVDLSGGGDNYYDATNNIFRNASGTERARINSSGMLAVNYTSTISGGLLVVSSNGVKQSLLVKNDDSVQLYSLGTGTVYSNAGVLTSTNPSDARLKTDVQDLNWGLSQVLALRPVSYAWKNNQINQGTQYGFIAQEVQTVMPDLVREFETKDGEETVTRFGLEKDGIYAAMVKAIQEQQAIIESLTQRIAILEAK